ncbi:MAG: type II toxin-antitoxin system HicA family toxin [Oscillospiraceae bacterium]|nr:type II toxin-antitoxin system HicA family toxin [Oscillospiraceae bacterium]
MPPVTKPEQIINGLERNGFRFIRQRGSHRKYRKEGKTVIVPMHYELTKGILQSIIKQSGLMYEELIK